VPIDVIAQALLQGLLVGAIYGLIALAMTLVFSVGGLLNFAHGDFIALSLFLAMVAASVFKLDPYLSAPVIAAGFLLLGSLMFRALVRPIMHAGHLVGAQLTLGIVFVMENGLLLVFGGEVHGVTTVLSNKNLVLGPIVLPWPLVVAATVAGGGAVALYAMLMATDFGRAIRAITQNPDAAALMGVNMKRIETLAFGLGIALLGLTGPLLAAQFTIHPAMGLDLTLLALIVVVLGGLGNFVGSMVGGLIIGASESVSTLFLGGTVGAMVPYLILIAVLLFRPHGLFGKA